MLSLSGDNVRIESYDFGVMVVNGKRYFRDLIITPSRIIENWWRDEGHKLKLKDLKDLKDEEFDILIVGTGYNGLMKVEREVLEEYKRKGVEVIAKPTREAVEEYNKAIRSGKRVVGAFHLTC